VANDIAVTFLLTSGLHRC